MLRNLPTLALLFAFIAPTPAHARPVPNLKFHDLTHQDHRLNDLHGSITVISFWATWCTPCQVEMPWFIALQQKYASQGFTVLGIDKDYPEDLPKVPGFARKMSLNYPILYGNEKTYAEYSCCDYLPMSYYVDRKGTVRIATIGLGERDTVESYIRRLLRSSPPQPDPHLTASAATTPPAQSK